MSKNWIILLCFRSGHQIKWRIVDIFGLKKSIRISLIRAIFEYISHSQFIWINEIMYSSYNVQFVLKSRVHINHNPQIRALRTHTQLFKYIIGRKKRKQSSLHECIHPSTIRSTHRIPSCTIFWPQTDKIYNEISMRYRHCCFICWSCV